MFNRFPRNVRDFLESYDGPYPLKQLKNARDALIYGFNTYNSDTFFRLHKIMYMENFYNDLNCEYSEDAYSDSEAESVNELTPPTEGKSSLLQSNLCSKPETSTKSVVLQSEVSNKQEAVKKTFYSTSGFRNRFAEYLLRKKSSSTFKTETNIKNLSNTKRKSSDDERYKAESSENANMGETDNHSRQKKAKTDEISGYKCDYCDFTSLVADETTEHLINSKHPYASQCKGKVNDGNFSARYTEIQCSLQFTKKPRTKVATCPTCLTTFPNIYTCASHHVFCSGNHLSEQHELVYGLSDIVHETEIMIPVDSVCQMCHLKCSRHRALNLHYEACQHYPFKNPGPANVLLAFVCLQCKKHFPGFFLAKSHAIAHPNEDAYRVLELIYYKTTSYEHKLLPSKLISQNNEKKSKKYGKVKLKNNSVRIAESSHTK